VLGSPRKEACRSLEPCGNKHPLEVLQYSGAAKGSGAMPRPECLSRLSPSACAQYVASVNGKESSRKKASAGEMDNCAKVGRANGQAVLQGGVRAGMCALAYERLRFV